MTTTTYKSDARGAGGGGGLGDALGGALQWRLLTAWTLLMLLPAAIVAMPVWRLLASLLDVSPRAAEMARGFDMLVVSDLVVGFERGATAVAGAATLATIVALLLSPLTAAMSVAVARQPGRALGFVELVQGGVAGYGRMFRMMLVSLVPMAVVGGIAAMASAVARKHGESAILESQATRASHLATILTVVAFIAIHATVEAGRAQLAADPTLRGGWRAWIRGLRMTAREPVAVFGRYLAVTVVSLLVATILLLVRIRVVGGSGATFWFGFLVTQLAVAAIGWGRAARLFALTSIVRPAQSAGVRAPATTPGTTPATTPAPALD